MSETQEASRNALSVLSNKKYIFFTSRCNESIRIATALLAAQDRKFVLYQDEGGWLTYKKYIEAAGLEPVQLITQDGLVYEKELERYDHDGVLLINSLAGYVAMHDMPSMYGKAQASDIVVVNDVSGSIGSEEARIGDIIVGSFGKAKPVNVGKGGFIATDNEEYYNWIKEHEEEFIDFNFALLEEKLNNLHKRIEFLKNTAALIKNDLFDMDIVHPDHEGLNVIVRFSNDEEREKIIAYCKEHDYEYTICPREIRINDDAVSIEVKRLLG